MISTLILILLSLFLCGNAAADASASDTGQKGSPPAGCTCFRGKPSPRCCTYFIFETGYKTQIRRESQRTGKDDFLLTADFGLMYNFESEQSIGASLYLAGDDDGSRFGIRPRYRRWLGTRGTLDFSLGLIVSGTDNYAHLRMPGLVASASLGYGDWFSIDVLFEAYRVERRIYDGFDVYRTETGTLSTLYIGVSGRSYAAFVTPIVVIIALIVDPMDDINMEWQ